MVSPLVGQLSQRSAFYSEKIGMNLWVIGEGSKPLKGQERQRVDSNEGYSCKPARQHSLQ